LYIWQLKILLCESLEFITLKNTVSIFILYTYLRITLYLRFFFTPTIENKTVLILHDRKLLP